MAISRKLAGLELSKSEEGEKKITTALGELQRQGLTLNADVVHQVREQAQKQGLYDIDSIKQLAKAYLNKMNKVPEKKQS